MAKQTYAFLRGAPKRLELSWGMFWRNFTVRLDGVELGNFNNEKELRAGKQFPLADGTPLAIQLKGNQLQVLRNNHPLPDSPTDPARRHKAGYSVIFFIAFVNMMLPLASLTPGNTPSTDFERVFMFGIGVVFGILGLYARNRSRDAVWIALAIFILDTFLGVFGILTGSLASLRSVSYIVGLFFRPFFIYTMYKTFEGIDYLEQYIFDPQPPVQNAPPAIDKPVTPREKLREAHRLMSTGGDRQRASTLVREALREDMSNPDCWYMSTYFADNVDQQRAALERTLDLNPNHSGARKVLARLKEYGDIPDYPASGQQPQVPVQKPVPPIQKAVPPLQKAVPAIDNPITPKDKLREAHRLMTTGGDKQRAKTLVNEALHEDMSNPDCWYMVSYFANNVTQKRSALERTLELNPTHSGAIKALERMKESFVVEDNQAPAAK